MSRLITRCSRLGIHTGWLGGPALCLLALLLVVVSGVSDSPQAGGPPGPDFRLLSPPLPQPNGAWRVTWSSTSGKTYQLQRAANDELNAANWVDVATLIATGPVTAYDDVTAARQRFYRVKLAQATQAQTFRASPSYFAPLDAGGLPVEGAVVALGDAGLLGPFVYRPGGQSTLGLGQGFSIVFPAGARLVTIEGRRWISFTDAIGRFGPKAPYQLRVPLAVNTASVRLLPLDDLDVAALLNAFGRPPEGGLEVTLFGRFALRIVGGVFTADGLRGARVELLDSSLPLPKGPNSYSGFVLEIEPDGGLKLPFSGSFGLDDGSGHGARLTVPPARPLWLELKANGDIALGGRAELAFSPGPQFSVDLLLNDPNYELAITAKGLRLPLFSALAGLLPATPAASASTDPAELAAATSRLRHFHSALTHFNAAVTADTPYGADESVTHPPLATARPSSVLDAWGYTALAGQTVPGAALTSGLTNAGHAASATRDIRSLLEYWTALQRLDVAATRGGLQLDAVVQRDLREAIDETAAAVIARSKSPDAVSSLANMLESLRALLEIEQLRQQTGFVPAADPGSSADKALEVQAAIAALVNRFAETFAAQLGATSGHYTPSPGSRIAGLSRREVLHQLSDFAELVKLREQLGLDQDTRAPLPETAGQLASQLWTLAAVELTQAEGAADGDSFTEVLADVIDLILLVDNGLVPTHPALAGLPNASSLESLFARWTGVLQAELTRSLPSAPEPVFSPAIVGGTIAGAHIPYQAALVLRRSDGAVMPVQQFCGGSILNERWILTAAHCLSNSFVSKMPANIAVLVGVTNLNQVTAANYYEVDQILVHPFYETNLSRWDYDVALVHLSRDIEFTTLNQSTLRAKEVSLLTPAEGILGQPALGVMGRASGWGYTSATGPGSVELRYADVPMSTQGQWPTNDLRSRYLLAGYLNPVPSSVCSGDSGGPLVVNGKQVGVVSFVIPCATPGFPDIYMRVSSFAPWIQAQSGLAPRESVEKLAKVLKFYRDALTTVSRLGVDLGAAPGIRLRCDRAEALIADVVVHTNDLPLSDLLAALRLGTTHARLREMLHYDHSRWWEGFDPMGGYVQTNLLQLAIAAAGKVRTERDWSAVSPTVDTLLAEADYLGTLGGREFDRQLYLQAARHLLEAVRGTSSLIYEDYAARAAGGGAGEGGGGLRPASAPPPADIALPGELQVHHVAGAARFNRETHAFSAAFSGDLELPGFDLRLTIPNASIASGGLFDLSLYGQVSLPPGSAQGRLIIPAARPLHVSLQRSGQLNFAGAARLELNNGMAFEAFLQLEDPLYRFGLSAQGLRFDLGKKLKVMVPTLPDGQVFAASAARDLNDYFRSLSGTLDGVIDASASLPAPRAPGQPPEFTVPTAVADTDAIEAWAIGPLADVHLNLTRDYAATFESVKENLKTLAASLKDRRGEISPEELELRLRVLGRICAANLVRRAAGQNAEADAIENAPEFVEFRHETEEAVLALLQRAPTRDDAYQEATLNTVNRYQQAASCFDESARTRVIGAIETFQTALWNAFATAHGISTSSGLIVDPSRLPLEKYADFRPVFLRYALLAKQHQSLNLSQPSASWVGQVGQTIALRWRSALLAQARLLTPSRDTDFTKLGLVSRDLAFLLCAGEQGGFTYPSDAIEQLDGPNLPYSLERELRNAFYRRFQAERFILVTELGSAGHVDKFTFETKPAPDLLPKHIRNIDSLVCRLRTPRDPFSTYVGGVLPPSARQDLQDYRSGSYLLTPCDLAELPAFANLLSRRSNPATDRLTEYLWNRFAGATQQILTRPGVTEAELRATLRAELNEILKGASIYTAERFQGIAITSRTLSLKDRQPTGADLIKLNRWLLEDAFPIHVVQSFDPPGATGEAVKVSLANALYELMQGPSLYTAERFAGIRLSPETMALLADPTADQLRALNRRLLEDAYPEELPRADVSVMKLFYPALELVRAPTLEDPNLCGNFYAGADQAEREVIQLADDEFLNARLTAAETRLLQTGTSGDLQGGLKLLKELIWLAGWAEKKQQPALSRIQAALGRLTIEFTTAAQARKAWWYLHEYTDILIEAAESSALAGTATARAAVLAEANNALRTAANLLNSFSLLLPGQRPVDLPLPGQVVINRVFGEVQYRRDTRQLSGRFGGRIEFPDLQNAFFEITEATLNSDLQFSIQAGTSGPLPFEGVTLTAAINANGGRDLPFNFTGAGTVTITNGPQFNAVVSWNGTNHTLSFNSQAGNLQSLRFTDDLVLFDAGLGFTVRPDSQAGELRANGSAGFFSKGDLPENGPITRTNFHLFAENVRAALAYQPGRVDLTFSNGTLYLPTFFYPTNMATLCPGQLPATGPTIALNPTNPVRATFVDGATPSVGFQGELDFRQFGLETPGFPGLAAAICSARLKFSNRELPYLTNVTASLQIPIPNQTNNVDLIDGVFTLTGYPSGRILLRNDLTMINLGGFKFTLLGQGHSECPQGSGLTVYPSAGFNQPPAFKLDGGLRVEVPAAMLTGATNDAAFGLACGSLAVTNGELPALEVQALQFGGTFHLGSGGPVIRNALISLEGLPNLFRLDNEHQFLARIEGRLQIPQGPEFILQDARFAFFDPNRLPKFSVAGIGVNNTNFTLMNYLPAQVTRAEMHFKAPMAELPGLFAPTNVTVLLSALIKFPATGTPMLVGAVDQLEVEFDLNGIPRVKNLDGFELGIGAMKLPPIKEIGGRIRIGGLSAGDARSVYLVGRLGGSFQGYTLVGQFAANLFGPLGFCIDVNAGAVGIPVGPTGILITGASGGESFVNNNGDPCDFSTYFTKDANGNIVAPSAPAPPGIGPGVGMTWEAFREVVERMEQQAQIFANNVPGISGGGGAPFAAASAGDPGGGFTAASGTSTVNLPCPGDCPPATVNIFCQPHPDQALFPGKIIAKFSSIDEPALNRIGITQERIQSLGGSLAVIAGEVAHAIRTNVANLTPPPDPTLLGQQAATALGNVITNALNSLEATFSNLCYLALGSPQAGETYYAVIRRLAYEGLPCPDVTMSVSGNVSYAGISSMAYISGKGVLSTAGAAGVIGTVYVYGVPLGQARVFVAATDKNGDPNPSICGEATVGFGPIDLGNVKISYACPGCVTGVLGGIPEMLAALSDALLYRIAARVAPEIPPNTPRVQLVQQLLALPDQRKLGIFAELANQPLNALPPNLPQVFFQGIADVYDAINPVFIACGEVSPKVFGLPLGSSLVSAKVFATKTEEAGSFQFSPSYLMSAFLPVLPGSDSASMSFAYQVPDPYAFIFGGLAGNFEPDKVLSYTQSAIDSMLQNSTIAVSYEIHPFGLSMGAAAGRVILPDLTSHPVLPWRNWVRPEERGIPNLPSRHELLLAALASDRLGDAVNWRGSTNDLYTIYPAGTPQRAALAGLSLSKDYFPHGGVLGAARVTLPAMLTEKPPLDKINVVLNAQANPLDRLTTAIDLVQNYILRFNTNGALGFYIPAPNPPAFYDLNGQLAGQAQLQSMMAASKPQDILNSIKSFDIASIQRGSLYPMEQAFLRGYLDGELLGVPILRADAVGLPADAGRSEGFLSVTSSIPSGSWLKQFIPQATLIFDARGVPPRPIEERFAELLSQMQAARNTNASAATMRQLADAALLALTGDLPKMRLTADLVAGLQMPAPVSDLLAFNGGAHFHGFSPRYEPTYDPTNNNPLAQVRREGGLAFQGNMRLKAGGVTLVDIANAEMSVIPKASGLPALAARLEAPVIPYEVLTFRDVLIDFASDPNPHFTAAGRVDPLAIGDFQLLPGLGSLFNGRLDVGTASVSAQLGPARIALPSLIPGTDTLLIHGATTNDPFSFSTTGNWNANLTVTSQLSLGVGGIDVLRLNSADFQSLRFYGSNGLNDATMEFVLKPNLSVAVFPGQGFQRSITLSPGGALLRVSKNGTFELTGTLGGTFALSSLPVTSVNAGASIRLTQDGLTLTAQAGQFTGGALGGVPANQASGSITFGRDSSVTLNGAVTVAPFSSGSFTMESPQGGANPINATINNQSLVLSGARLVYRGAVLAVLPEVTVQNNGNFTVAVGSPVPVSLALGNFSLNNVAFTLQRIGGAISVPTFNGSLSVPGLNRLSTVGGSLLNNGNYTLQGTLGSAASFNGLPVTTLAASATVTLTQGGLAVSGGVSGGAAGQVSFVGGATASLAITTNGAMTISGTLTVSPLTFGQFVIESTSGGNLAAHFSNAALTLSNAQLRVNNVLNSPIPLPNFTMPADGNFTIPVGGSSRSILGYSCAVSSFTLKRQSGVVSVNPLSANLNITGFIQTLTGSISSDGQVALDYIGPLTMPGGWPITSGELHLRNSGLSAHGNLAVTGLGTLTLDGSITNNGGYSISQSIATSDFFGFPAQNAAYTLSAPANLAGTLTAWLQLNLPNLGTPRFAGTLNLAGTFALQALNQNLSLAGFGMTAVDFTLSKTNANPAALFVSGNLNLPGFGAPINNRLTGSIATGGSINMTNLSGPLSLGGYNLGSGSLALNDSGLFAHGTLGISGLTTLTFDGEIQKSGAFSLSQSFGSQSFFGFPAQNVAYTFAAAPGSQASIATRLNVSFGDISSLTFDGTLATDGTAHLRAAARAWTIGSFALTNLTLNFDHAAGTPLASLSASASLFFPNFSQNISGSFGANGSYSLRYSGGLTLGTFFAGNGALTLTNQVPRLRASGSFDVRVAGRPLGTVPFAGNVNVGGGYSLLPNGGWNLGNFIGLNSGNNLFSSLGSGSSGSLTLTSGGITGSDTLRYGNLDIPINITGCTSSGISFSGSRSVTDDVSRTWDPASPPAAPCTIPSSPPAPCAELGDVYSGASATVSINANNSNGSFSVSASGFWAWWVVVDYLGTIQNPCTTSESCSFGMLTSTRYRFCADIRNTFDGIPAAQKPGFGPVGIASDGKLFFNESHGADGQPVQNGFTFFLW